MPPSACARLGADGPPDFREKADAHRDHLKGDTRGDDRGHAGKDDRSHATDCVCNVAHDVLVLCVLTLTGNARSVPEGESSEN